MYSAPVRQPLNDIAFSLHCAMFVIEMAEERSVKVVHIRLCSDSVFGPRSKQKPKSLQHCNRRPVWARSAEASSEMRWIRASVTIPRDGPDPLNYSAAATMEQRNAFIRSSGSYTFLRLVLLLVQLIQTGPIQSE